MCSGSTPVQCHTAFGKIQLPPAQCCCAKQADSRLVLLQTHLWRFALPTGVQWPNTSAVPHSAFGCATAQTACPLIQLTSAVLAMHSCNSSLLQNRLTAGLCCCKYTYGDLLFPQVCSGPTPVQCQSAFGKAQLPLAHCCCAKQADSRLVLLQIHLWRFALDTGVQWSNTSAVPHCFWQSTVAPCSLLLCKTG